ncbi:MAG: 4Fe-4S binding protein [Prevotellaceae bacterium]|nr:4Fe-4S binding protein [Prevotellaceae bacterium]
MIQIVDKRECSGCTACEHICPQHCIAMVADEEVFLYPKVDESRCIDCGLCDKVCPTLIQFNGLIEFICREISSVSGASSSENCVLPGKRNPGYCNVNVIISTS